jgi:peptidyl-prolyl cis-trans isomerase SurA
VKGETVEKEYPEFGGIMKEYTDGILLYQIEQERVWGRVAVNDTMLQKHFEANRDKFNWPDRVDFSSISLYSDSLSKVVHTRLSSGATFEKIVAEDSVRLKMPNNFSINFAKTKSALTTDASKTVTTIGIDLKNDATLRVQLSVFPDTSSSKAQNEKLAKSRLDAVKAILTKKYGIEESRIVTMTKPQMKTEKPKSAKDSAAVAQQKEAAKLANRLDIEILNRRTWFVGGIENQLQAVATDERSMKADSLHVGAFSSPFNYRGNYTIVRLNKKEPARRKTFAEAGTEVSSAFQEYESKRLEKEWLDGLRQRYPVVEHKEVLKNAFAPAK